MFFIAAKIFWTLFQPSNLAAICAIIGLCLAWRWRRTGLAFLGLGAVVLIVFGVLPTSQYLMAPLENRFERPDYQTAQGVAGIIILGGTERPSLSRARQFPILGFDAARLAGAAAVIQQLPEKSVIFSGGITEPNGLSQADVAGDYLASLGIPRARLILERKSRNTAENASETYAMLKPNVRQGRWLLITSAFHMPRAVGAFRAAGLEVIPYPVAYQTTGVGVGAWVFDVAENLRLSDLAVHEWIGLAAYYWAGKSSSIFPAPLSSGHASEFPTG